MRPTAHRVLGKAKRVHSKHVRSVGYVLLAALLTWGLTIHLSNFASCDPSENIDFFADDEAIVEKLAKRSIVMLNAWAGDEEEARIQCQVNPDVAVCTDTRFDNFPCQQVVTKLPFDYNRMTNKKLQCMSELRKIAATESYELDILMTDADMVIKPEIATTLSSTHEPDSIVCNWGGINPVHELPNKDGRYYVWREHADLPKLTYVCLGFFIFIPHRILSDMYTRLEYFEHFRADDVAFSWFFHQMNYTITPSTDSEFRSVHYKSAYDLALRYHTMGFNVTSYNFTSSPTTEAFVSFGRKHDVCTLDDLTDAGWEFDSSLVNESRCRDDNAAFWCPLGCNGTITYPNTYQTAIDVEITVGIDYECCGAVHVGTLEVWTGCYPLQPQNLSFTIPPTSSLSVTEIGACIIDIYSMVVTPGTVPSS